MRQQLRGNRNNREVALVLVAAAAGAAMLGHGLLEYTLSTFEGALLLAILGGTILGAQDRVEGRLKVKPWMVVALLLPIMGVGFWKLGLEPQRAARLREEASLALTTPLDPQRGVALATQSIAIDPWHPAGYELRARLDQRLGGTRFLADMTRARELQPRSGRLAQELALYHAERGQWAEALKLQEEAIALHPLNLGHRLTYARLLASSGRLDDARTAWRQALDVKAFRDSEVYLRMAVGRELGLEEELPPLPLHLRGR
jgi:tetratricopeptide (TPR) repeat protein